MKNRIKKKSLLEKKPYSKRYTTVSNNMQLVISLLQNTSRDSKDLSIKLYRSKRKQDTIYGVNS
jgi:hypothetical protein